MLPTSRLVQNGLYLAFLTWTLGVSASPLSSSLETPVSATPTPVSVTPSFVAHVSENTHTSTIGSDGQTTSVPIIGGPSCWFCPTDDEIEDSNAKWAQLLGFDGLEEESNGTKGAWALRGIDAPGIYQPSAVSEFSQSFPLITVLSNGDPVYSHSSGTTDQPATNVKRDALPTETVYHQSNRFKLLTEYLPKSKWRAWFGKQKYPDDAGFAMSIKMIAKWGFISRPVHYGLIAGFVEYATLHQEMMDDCDYRVEKIIVNHTIDWNITSWDLHKSKTDFITYDHFAVDEAWPSDPLLHEKAKFRFLGRIQDSASVDFIQDKANGLVDDMNARGGYNYVFNNCRDFAYYLYKRIRY